MTLPRVPPRVGGTLGVCKGKEKGMWLVLHGGERCAPPFDSREDARAWLARERGSAAETTRGYRLARGVSDHLVVVDPWTQELSHCTWCGAMSAGWDGRCAPRRVVHWEVPASGEVPQRYVFRAAPDDSFTHPVSGVCHLCSVASKFE